MVKTIAILSVWLMACGVDVGERGADGAQGLEGAQGEPGPAGAVASSPAPCATPVHRLYSLSKTVDYDGPGFPRGANYPGLSLLCPEGAALVSGSCEADAPLILDRPIPSGEPNVAKGWGCQTRPEVAPSSVTVTAFVVCAEAQ